MSVRPVSYAASEAKSRFRDDVSGAISSPCADNLLDYDPMRPDFAPFGLTAMRFTVPFREMPIRHHNEIEILFFPEHSFNYLLAGHRVQLPVRRLFVFWAAQPHQIIDIQPSTPNFHATVPLSTFLQWRLPGRFVRALLSGQWIVDIEDGNAALDQELFTHWCKDSAKADAVSQQVVAMEIRARLFRLAHTSDAIDAQPPRSRCWPAEDASTVLDTAAELAAFAAAHCREPIRVAHVAKAVGVHPAYAAVLFHKTFGTTLVRYLGENRISNAKSLLASTDAKIIDVALGCGYESVRSFNAAFRTICRCTPGEYRRRCRQSADESQ